MTAVTATTTSSFLDDVSAAEQRTPLPPPPPPMPDPTDPEYAGNPEALEAAQQAAQAAAVAFGEGAKRRGDAVGQVVSAWLATAPLDMLQQLLDQPDSMPIFRPAIGPVVVARHEHVLACLSRPDVFTVDLYAPEMARATDDRTRHPDALTHFLLGTDDDDLYRIDDVLLRRAVSPADESLLTTLARAEAESWARLAAGSGEVDV